MCLVTISSWIAVASIRQHAYQYLDDTVGIFCAASFLVPSCNREKKVNNVRNSWIWVFSQNHNYKLACKPYTLEPEPFKAIALFMVENL
jgi:arginyl-tRNA--protein-N-Asp/Glu arginylyltransferase